MRHVILLSALAVLVCCGAAAAQTRRIAAASHSGRPTSRDEDHFGLDPRMMQQMRRDRDSLARVDSLRAADSSSRRLRVRPRAQRAN